MRKACSTYERLGMRTKLYLENMKGRHHLEDTGVDRRIILKRISKK